MTEDTTITRESDLTVAKSDNPDPVVAGTNVTYTVTVTNNGPSDASGVTLTDTIPMGTTFVSASPAGANCTETAGVVTCALGNLAAGQSTQVTLVAAVDSSLAEAATITNQATGSATETDPDSTNNSVTEENTITRESDLTVAKSDLDPSIVERVLAVTVR